MALCWLHVDHQHEPGAPGSGSWVRAPGSLGPGPGSLGPAQARWRARRSAALWIRTGPEGAQLRVCVRWNSVSL